MNTTTLAMHGGPKAVTLDQTEANRWPILTAEDEAAVIDVMRHGDLSTHPVTRELEANYQQRLGRLHAVAHANGTLALLAAFHALDLKPGDEVLVPSATFWASVLPMLWVGAVPVFCEIEGDRFGLDPEDVERKITPRTRAMVVVHLWGMPAKMTELCDIARVQLKHLDERNARRKHNIEWLNAQLEGKGIESFPGPAHVERVYFENLVRYRPEQFGGLPLEMALAALQAEGCAVAQPRYPLVHQQPFFTEGHWRSIARLGDDSDATMINVDGLPLTSTRQQNMMRLPNFPSATPALLEQYVEAFAKVRDWAICCAEASDVQHTA